VPFTLQRYIIATGHAISDRYSQCFWSCREIENHDPNTQSLWQSSTVPLCWWYFQRDAKIQGIVSLTIAYALPPKFLSGRQTYPNCQKWNPREAKLRRWPRWNVNCWTLRTIWFRFRSGYGVLTCGCMSGQNSVVSLLRRVPRGLSYNDGLQLHSELGHLKSWNLLVIEVCGRW